MQRDSVLQVEFGFRAINATSGNDTAKLLCGSSLVPASHGRKRIKRIFSIDIEINGSVEDKLCSDQPACVVARRIVVARAQVISRAVTQLARVVDVEETDFRARPLVAVTDDGNRIAGDEH